MRRILFALPLLAATMTFAQAPVQPPGPFTLHHVYALAEPAASNVMRWGCPVGMAAEQQATGATQWVVSLEDSGSSGGIPRGKMGVHVALKAPANWVFREARVAVTYKVSPAGAMLVDGQVPDTTKTFDLSVGDDPAVELERSLLLGAGVSVQRVKLMSLTYPDGSVWQPAPNYNCSVRVSHFLPVAAR